MKAPDYFIAGMKIVNQMRREIVEEATEKMGTEVTEENFDHFIENNQEELEYFKRLDKKAHALMGLKDFLFYKVISENYSKFENELNAQIVYDEEDQCIYEEPFISL